MEKSDLLDITVGDLNFSREIDKALLIARRAKEMLILLEIIDTCLTSRYDKLHLLPDRINDYVVDYVEKIYGTTQAWHMYNPACFHIEAGKRLLAVKVELWDIFEGEAGSDRDNAEKKAEIAEKEAAYDI